MSGRPIGIWILVVVFGWHGLKSLEILLRGERTADYQLFKATDTLYMYRPLVAATFLADTVACWVLLSPASYGYWVVAIAIGLDLGETTVAMVAARRHPEKAREAYRLSRESRGLRVREGALEFATNPRVSLALWLLTVCMSVLWLGLATWNRDYFLAG